MSPTLQNLYEILTNKPAKGIRDIFIALCDQRIANSYVRKLANTSESRAVIKQADTKLTKQVWNKTRQLNLAVWNKQLI